MRFDIAKYFPSINHQILISEIRSNYQQLNELETKYQQKLKWYIYCEFDLEKDEDIEAVLNSFIKDIISSKQSKIGEKE